MQRHLSLAFFLLLFLLLINPAHAAPSLNASVSSEYIQQDQTALLILQIKWPKSEGTYSFALPEPDFENLSLIRRGESQEFFNQNSEDWVQKTFELELKPLSVGEAKIRDFTITYVNPTNQSQGSLQVTAMPLKIRKAPNPSLNFSWLAIGGGIGLVILGASFGWVIAARKKKAAPILQTPLSAENAKAIKIKALIESGVLSKESFHSRRHYRESHWGPFYRWWARSCSPLL